MKCLVCIICVYILYYYIMYLKELPPEENEEHWGMEMIMEDKDIKPWCHMPVIFVKHIIKWEEAPFWYLIPLDKKDEFYSACKLYDETGEHEELDKFERRSIDWMSELRVQLFVDESQYEFEYCEEWDI